MLCHVPEKICFRKCIFLQLCIIAVQKNRRNLCKCNTVGNCKCLYWYCRANSGPKFSKSIILAQSLQRTDAKGTKTSISLIFLKIIITYTKTREDYYSLQIIYYNNSFLYSCVCLLCVKCYVLERYRAHNSDVDRSENRIIENIIYPP